MYRHALLALACLVLVAPALAVSPLWTHNSSEPVRDCAVSNDGKVIVVSSDLVHIFDRKGGLAGTTWHANAIAVNAAGSLVVSGTGDAARGVSRNGSELWSAPNASVAVAVSNDGATIAALGPGGLLSTFTAAGGRVGTTDTGATGEALAVAVSKNGSVVVTTDGGGVRAFTRKGAHRWSVELATPSALAMNASGDLVAVGDGGSVKFFNLTGERLARFPTSGRVRSLAMTPSANLTVAGGEDGSVAALGPGGELLWNRSAGAPVNRVAVSGSGALVAVASADRRLRLLAGNGTPLWDAGLAGDPLSLSLSADGTTVAVGCDEGTAYVFDTGAKSPAAPAKAPNATPAGNVTATVNATGARNGTAGLNASATIGKTTVTVSGATKVNVTGRNATATTAANRTAAGNRTANFTTTASPNATATTSLRLVIPNGTATSGVPAFLPVAALALLGAWAGLRRRR